MDYSNQQVICATCDRWCGKRKILKNDIVRSDSITSGICKGGEWSNFNTNPGTGRGCNTHIRWDALDEKP